MSNPWDFTHIYRWLKGMWPKSYWVKTIVEPHRYSVRFVAAASHHRLDCYGSDAQSAAARLIWFGLLLNEPAEITQFLAALTKERERLASLVDDSGSHLGEIALERAHQHLVQRAELQLAGYQLAVQVEEYDTLRAFLFLGKERYEALYPVETFAERMSADVGIIFSDKDQARLSELFRLEAELFHMSFKREGGDLENTSGVLLDIAGRLASA